MTASEIRALCRLTALGLSVAAVTWLATAIVRHGSPSPYPAGWVGGVVFLIVAASALAFGRTRR